MHAEHKNPRDVDRSILGECRDRLVHWTQEELDGFGKRFVIAEHRIHQTRLFTDEALIDLIDSYPRHRLQAFTMGTDPECLHELEAVDTRGVSGKDVIAAVKAGSLWFKLQRIDLWKGPYADLIQQLYDELKKNCGRFKPLQHSAVVLLGSTGSQVYFHADAKPNMLWHIRGRKRFWLYPPTDNRFIRQDLMEDIFENVQDEEVPYSPNFDQFCQKFDLAPGQVLSWPQNTAHRVLVVEGLSVSISTFHETEESVRRGHIYGMNRFLRRSVGIQTLATREKGLIPWSKALAYRVLRRVGLINEQLGRVYQTEFRIDPHGYRGVSRISNGKVITEFSLGLHRGP